MSGEGLASLLQALTVLAASPPTEKTDTGRSWDLTVCLAALRALKAPHEAADMAIMDEHEPWLRRYPAAHAERFRDVNQCMEAMDCPADARACEALLSGRGLG